jgi:hypothetical protein
VIWRRGEGLEPSRAERPVCEARDALEALDLRRESGAKRGGGRGIRTPGTLPGTVVFKTTAIDHSAIPPRRESGHNSRFSRERRPHHPVSVTVSVTNGTARDDRGPARPYDSARPIEVLSEAESIRQRGNRRFSRGAPWVVPRFIEMLADEWS